MALGEAIALSSTGALLMFVGFLALSHYPVAHLEEPLLRKRFGRAYEEHCASKRTFEYCGYAA